MAVPQDTDCVTTIKTTEEKLANKKKELEVFQVLWETMINNNAFSHNILLFFTSQISVRILWDKEEIRRSQRETWEWCERYHRTDPGLYLNSIVSKFSSDNCLQISQYFRFWAGLLIYIIPVTRVNQDLLHRLIQSLLIRIEPCSTLEASDSKTDLQKSPKQEREGAYTDYQDASALKYSHVPSASR